MHDNVSSGSPSGRNDGKSCHPGSATLETSIVTTCYQEPQPEIFFSYQRPIVPFRNRNMENFSNMAMCHQDLEHESISNMATCHQDPEPELDYRLELDEV